MDLTVLSLVVYVATGLIIAAVLLLWRDLLSRRKAAQSHQVDRAGTPANSEPVVLSPDVLSGGSRSESWLSQLVSETGSGFTPETALLLAIACGLALGGALFLWRDNWLAGAAGAVLGMLAVGALLFTLRARRYAAIREQLPDVMEIMARAVRAGESVDQAIALAANSSQPPLGAEFRRLASQMKMGLSLEAAIRGLLRRAPLGETRVLAMILIVQRQRGGSLPTALERLARVFRDRLAFYRQFRAATAARRGAALLIAIVALILDVVVLLWQPEYVRSLLETTAGRVMLAASLALQVIGVFWATWLFRSEY